MSPVEHIRHLAWQAHTARVHIFDSAMFRRIEDHMTAKNLMIATGIALFWVFYIWLLVWGYTNTTGQEHRPIETFPYLWP
jgi:hypothetical protein